MILFYDSYGLQAINEEETFKIAVDFMTKEGIGEIFDDWRKEFDEPGWYVCVAWKDGDISAYPITEEEAIHVQKQILKKYTYTDKVRS